MWFKIILVFILFKKKKKSQHFKNIFDVEEIGHKEVILLCICHDSCDAQIN